MYIFIPISRLHIEHPIILKNITLNSIISIDNYGSVIVDNKEYPKSVFSKTDILDLFDDSFAVYYMEQLSDFQAPNELVEHLIRPVDYALDSIRVYLNSFSFHEQIMGTPGFYKGSILAVALNDDFDSYEVIQGNKSFFGLSEGIGCDATDFCTDETDVLLSYEENEVYSKYRNILHRLFKSMQIYDANTCFAFLFSTIEGIDCVNSHNFQTKKTRILSFIVENQEEFDILSQQFYFYSKTVRTEIIHAGKSLFEILPWKRIYELLNDLYLLVVRFCMAAIESGATTIHELNEKICRKCDQYTYSSPHDDITISEMPTTVSGKCDYFAEVNNLNLTACLKLGETLFIPAPSQDLIRAFQEIYEYGLGLCLAKNLDEKEVRIDSDFPYYDLFSNFNVGNKSFTVWDVDVIFTSLFHCNNFSTSFAIIENQPYWEQTAEGSDYLYSCNFSDIICNKIQNSLNYLVLSSEMEKNSILPSKVGVDEGIRSAYIRPEGRSGIYYIAGRVYGDYVEPNTPFVPSLTDCSEILYNCFFDSRSDEVFCTNYEALNRIANSMYFQDINQTMLATFDALDMLYTTTYDGNKLMKRIATFCCDTQTEKTQMLDYLKNIRENVRNPMLHGGKSITDLYLSEDDTYLIINSIISIIIKYSKNTYMLGVHTFQDLHKEEQNRNKAFAVRRNLRRKAGPDARRQEGIG